MRQVVPILQDNIRSNLAKLIHTKYFRISVSDFNFLQRHWRGVTCAATRLYLLHQFFYVFIVDDDSGKFTLASPYITGSMAIGPPAKDRKNIFVGRNVCLKYNSISNWRIQYKFAVLATFACIRASNLFQVYGVFIAVVVVVVIVYAQ